MRIRRCYLVPWLFLFLIACSGQQEFQTDSKTPIEVVFNAKQTKYFAGEQDLLSILVFKKIENSGRYTMISNIRSGDWQQDSETKLYRKSILLSSGIYRFLMAQGFSDETSDKQIFLGAESVENASNSFDKEYFFYYPSEKNEAFVLKRCDTELLADAIDPAFEPVDTEYSLQNGNTFSANRKVSRLQGRIDFLLRRGKKTGDAIETINEGENNGDAMLNALKKIETIHVKLSNVSSCWNINSQRFSTPASYAFSLQEWGGDYGFIPFNSQDFVKEFSSEQSADYEKFENTAYCKGPLLFPAPDNEDVHAMIEIVYKNPLPAKTMNININLHRNEVSLITLWLLTESVGADVAIETDELEYSDNTVGDDGFWN